LVVEVARAVDEKYENGWNHGRNLGKSQTCQLIYVVGELTWFDVQKKSLVQPGQREEFGRSHCSYQRWDGRNQPTTLAMAAAAGGLVPTSRGQGNDSPGSSVFDLPTQSTRRPALANTLRLPHNQDSDVPIDSELGPSFVVISGGTGGNAICSAFGNAAAYVLPVSDDGGSSSEIIRVLGGPSIGNFLSSPPCQCLVYKT